MLRRFAPAGFYRLGGAKRMSVMRSNVPGRAMRRKHPAWSELNIEKRRAEKRLWKTSTSRLSPLRSVPFPPETSVPSVSEDDSIFPEAPQGAPTDSAAPSGPPALISPPPPPPAPPAQLAIDCLKAIAYGASNFKSIFILVLYAAALGFLRNFLWPLIFAGPAGTVILGSLGAAAMM